MTSSSGKHPLTVFQKQVQDPKHKFPAVPEQKNERINLVNVEWSVQSMKPERSDQDETRKCKTFKETSAGRLEKKCQNNTASLLFRII